MRRRPSDPPSSDDALQQAREGLVKASADVHASAGAVVTIEAELAALRAGRAIDDPLVAQKVVQRDQAKQTLATARATERAARESVRSFVQVWLPSDGASEVSRLSAHAPIVLLPVRIETRFGRRPPGVGPWLPSLMVRIYPDEIAIDTHEPQLTAAESAAGAAYWETAKTKPESEAWRFLLMTYPAPRAAWIVRQTAPPSTEDDQDFHLFLPPRSSSWTRAAMVYELADRWHVLAYRGENLVASAIGNAIIDPLFVSLDPGANASELQDVSGDGLEIDRDLVWTVDYQTAVNVGMAVTLPITQEDMNLGFDQLFVIGVKSSVAPQETHIATLFDSHHYTRGWSFVRQGTPVHNTSEARSPIPADDAGGEHSFPIERGTPLVHSGSNGQVFVNALALPPNLANHVENADLFEQPHARAFNDAIWPGTLGYYIRQMLNPMIAPAPVITAATAGRLVPTPQRFTFGSTADSEARNFFVEYVRGIAALPSFRVGTQGYGLLPVTSLARWQPGASASGFDRALPPLLRTLLSIWTSTLDKVPRVGRSEDTEADLLATLGIDARSRRVWVRQGIGPTAHFNLLAFLGVKPDSWNEERETIARNAMAAIGHPEWDPFIAWMAFGASADLFAHELVATTPSESDSLAPNYILSIRSASLNDLRKGPSNGATPTALLFQVLRYAVITEYDRLASLLTVRPGGSETTLQVRPDPELVGFQQIPTMTAWGRLEQQIPGLGPGTLFDYLVNPAREQDNSGTWSYRQSLAAIEDLPTAELDRLFTSALDTCSHRLDAWATALATKRLWSMRVPPPVSGGLVPITPAGDQPPVRQQGTHRGAYGWVENLRPPGFERTRTLDDGRIAIEQENSAGYIQAPTMTHASAAAVLRNSSTSRIGADIVRFNVDLSSDRVRKALRMLEKVRSGESLGSALGHQFERGLLARGQNLRSAVESLRRTYPLVANKLADSHQPAELVAAPNVVDGLRLLDAYRENNVPFDVTILPAGSNERSAVEGGLFDLADTIDAISELLTAESVFQSARGNTTTAAASLDAIARGARPPEIECVRQPRGGTALTHRFAIILGAAIPPTHWSAPPSPRSIAEPHLDAWIGLLLGDPSTVRCRITGTQPVSGQPVELVASLADLQIRPIDFFALANESADAAAGPTELDRRLGLGNNGTLHDLEIHHAPWPDRTIRSFPEAIEMARAIRALIAASRPLRPEDLVEPKNSTLAKRTSALSTNGRGAAALITLQAVLASLTANANPPGPDASALQAALFAASQYGVPGAYSSTSAATPSLRDEMIERGGNVIPEVQRRISEASRAADDDAIARAVFGPDFVMLPAFNPILTVELDQARAYSPTLIGEPMAVTTWLQKAAPVRPSLSAFRSMTLYANAAGGSSSPLAVVQLPFVSGASWVALPFADEAHRPPSGQLSIVMQRVVDPTAVDKWAGLLVDEWSEIIPSASEQSGVALQYDNPRAEAPRVVLLAVPPVERETWEFDDLVACVRETLQLAKVRGADLETLGPIGQLVPALCLASNEAGDAVATQLSSMLGRPVERVET